MVFDLAGDGKTVLKANYGLYWHNPGVGISQNANPNIASKSQTHSWNDQAACAGCIAGDRRWQSGEESAAPTAQTLQGAIRLNPDIKAPISHEASAWVERQFTETMGVRAGFVYKTEDDLITNQYQLERGPAPTPRRSRSSIAASTACSTPPTIARSTCSASRRRRTQTSRRPST